MAGYLARTLLKMALTLWLIATIVFFATRMSGEAVDFIAPEGMDAQSRREMIAYFGLDAPMSTQYWRFLVGLSEGEFGLSLIERRPVATIFLERVGPSLSLLAGALAVTLAVAIPAGVFAAVRRGSAASGAVMTLAFIGYATPNFVLATLMLLVFSFWLQLLPSAGNATALHYVMPVTALSAFYVASLTRYTRNAMLDVLGQDYLRTARAKGLPERTVILKHALRNTLVTVLSVLGLMVSGLAAAGNVVIETVFSWRGVGDLLVSAALRRDYPVLQFGVMAVACAVVAINALVDIAYAAVDPRVRLTKR
ncbi:MAG: ABC transporter permease [Rubrimonas sp.]|uniref:ABC transporter permease n=1 Tax=Rubrimonas sp. TaxID=2036015 RepID=UPI002FDE01CC